MIAESRPQTYKSSLEESEMDLFAGLSFPAVPKTSIVLNKAPIIVAAQNSLRLNEVESGDISIDSGVGAADDVETTQLLLPPEEKTSIKRGNLSTLYATEVIVSEVSAYPELPSLGHNSPVSKSGERSKHNEYEEDVGSSESSSLLGNRTSESGNRNHLSSPAVFVQSNVPVQHQQQNTTQQQQQQQPEDASLVTDLIRENTRLADELANLRGIAQLQNGGTETTTTTTNSNKTSATATATSTSAPATGIKISDTSMPPKQGVKYVCCGGCRQWLLAPRDAVYVACGSCQAVNNCNLVSNKARSERSNADAETRALQQPAPVRRTLPWFLDCFGGPPADA